MKNTTSLLFRGCARSSFALALLAIFSLALPAHAEDDPSKVSFDNLKRIEDARVAVAYIDPKADFSVFQRVAILDPLVAFRSNWQRDQNRNRSRRVSARDMERIKADVAALFKDVFTEALEANNGFEIVDETGHDVLILRPAIIDLDITAPDTMSAGRSRSFTASAGAATLYVELFDSVSGQIIGRAADRRTARQAGGMMTWSNRVTNTSEARRMIRRWANKLREFLDEHYMPGEAKTE